MPSNLVRDDSRPGDYQSSVPQGFLLCSSPIELWYRNSLACPLSSTFSGLRDLDSQWVADMGEGSAAGHQALSSVDQTSTRKPQGHTSVNVPEHVI